MTLYKVTFAWAKVSYEVDAVSAEVAKAQAFHLLTEYESVNGPIEPEVIVSRLHTQPMSKRRPS
ncbi:MAG: hypothetical protein V1809_00265 [Planctomycetota bacterium]